jgi:hypothetical protein
MAKKKFKLGKFLVVISLTILIWVWADRAKTETLTITTGLIKINESADPKLWITFNNKKSFNIEKIVLEGAASKIDEVQRKLRERQLSFEFFLGPEQQSGLGQPGEHSLNVLELLRTSQNIRQLGLRVQSCTPTTISVQVHGLVENSLSIECIDENGSVLKHERIEPSKVTIAVPEDWAHSAQVRLTASEITQARSRALSDKIPLIELPDGQLRYSSTAVTVKLPPAQEKLPTQSIQATLGIVVSPVLFGEYDIEIKNRAELSIVNIKATSAAAQRYKNEPFQIYLYILDEDAKKEGTQSKPVVYNFPDELVRNNEIELVPPPAVAEFELIPLASNPSGG